MAKIFRRRKLLKKLLSRKHLLKRSLERPKLIPHWKQRDKPANSLTKKNASRFLKLAVGKRQLLRRLALSKAVAWTDAHGNRHLFSTCASLVNGEVGQMRFEGEVYLVTHAAALHWGTHGRPLRWFYELSHYCGIPFCLVHTRWELPWVNSSRDGCHKYKCYKGCPHGKKCLPQASLSAARKAMKAGIAAREAAELARMTAARLAKQARNKANYARRQPELQEKSRDRQREVRKTKPENYKS